LRWLQKLNLHFFELLILDISRRFLPEDVDFQFGKTLRVDKVGVRVEILGISKPLEPFREW